MKKILSTLLLISSIAYSQQNKKDTSVYYLVGNENNFQLLYLALKSPTDITPRQDSFLVSWVRSARKPEIQKPKDSTKINK